MSVRYGMRLGGGVWMTGGGGVLALGLALSVLWGFTYALLVVAASVLTTVLVAVGRAIDASKSSRRSLVRGILADSVEVSADEALAGGAKVWAVYAVGGDFHHGPHPAKGAALRVMYPSHGASIARVAAFPDSRRASRAAAALRRHRFSSGELRALFPDYYRPAPSLPAPAGAAEPSAAMPITQEKTMPDKPGPTVRDRTQYRFDGQTLGKARLVQALVRRWVRDHPDADFAALRAAFPDELQARSPIQFSSAQTVVARLDDLPAEHRERYFTNDEDLVRVRDDVVVVSREWNLHNIQNVLRAAEGMGYEIA